MKNLYQCSICGYRSEDSQEVEEHELAHSGKMRDPFSFGSEANVKRLYQCEICGSIQKTPTCEDSHKNIERNQYGETLNELSKWENGESMPRRVVLASENRRMAFDWKTGGLLHAPDGCEREFGEYVLVRKLTKEEVAKIEKRNNLFTEKESFHPLYTWREDSFAPTFQIERRK